VEDGLAGEAERYRNEVRQMVAEVLHVPSEKVHDELSFGDLPEWDSLGHMDLLMTLEERYGIPLDEELIARLISIDAICREIADRQHA
jgi:citrate synthase